jgi:hypothetical protein
MSFVGCFINGQSIKKFSMKFTTGLKMISVYAVGGKETPTAA